MSTVVGGLRARFLQDTFQGIVRDGLTQLGWFAAGRHHKPLVFLAEPQDWDQPVEFNSMVVTTRARSDRDAEVGSNFTSDAVRLTVDLYVEGDSLGLDLANDIRDLLRGRLGFGPVWGGFEILDLRMATPTAVGRAVVQDVRATRLPPKIGLPFTLYMFGVDADIIDHYYSEDESP